MDGDRRQQEGDDLGDGAQPRLADQALERRPEMARIINASGVRRAHRTEPGRRQAGREEAGRAIEEREAEVVNGGGIALPPQGPAIAFVQLAPSSSNQDGTICHDDRAAKSIPEARRYPVAFHRAGLMAMEMIRMSEARQVVATADADSDVAVRWLKRLGFKSAGDQPIEGKILFVWNRDHATDARPSSSARNFRPPQPRQSLNADG